jgi:hypothetical protein
MAEGGVRDQDAASRRSSPAAPARTAPGALREPPRSATDRLVTGVLVKHGRAPYGFQRGGEASYFVTLNTERGERTIWGRGLERALSASRTQPQPGEAVGVRENGISPMTVVMRERNARGEVVTVNRADTPRGHWVIERRNWFDERLAAAEALRDARVSRREAIRNHPELLGAYWALDSAGKVAEARIRNPESRERFVQLVRETLAHAIERGEPIAQQRSRGPRDGKAREEALSPSRAGEIERTR